ncbi:PBS lyase [Streptomyces sp. NPDC047315]|uniref:HEAT repeat domain-containing protein n=1 Tax=Streptomyces sp. NPDC047315 TaxID=3155142 RepID=UPI0033C62529
MFGGIDEVDWASLEHAYGPAGDVPELLRGLASPDPAVREAALDGMYATVHHQGEVFDSTLACIPFLLELAGDPAVQDRGGVIELLTSIGGIDLDGDDALDLVEDEEFESAANYAMAASAVTAGADVFLAQVGADDRGVRLAVPLALASLHAEPALVLALLRERLKVEQDPEVRLACVEAGGRIALRHDRLNPEVVEWLTGLTRVPHDADPSAYDPDAYAIAPPYEHEHEPYRNGSGTGNGNGNGQYERQKAGARGYDPGLRLSALAQLARCAPHRLPDDVVPGVTGLLRELRGGTPEAPSAPTPPPQHAPAPSAAARLGQSGPNGPSGQTNSAGTNGQSSPNGQGGGQGGQLGHLRARPDATTTERAAPWTGALLRTLHSGLGDRVDDRVALLADQLCSPDQGQRIDAVRMSSGLLRTWRGEYAELVALLGEQLPEDRGGPRLADAAIAVLGELFALAEPATDALAEYVAANPDRWVQEWVGGPLMLGGAVTALARTGDARAVPVLTRMLELPEAPQDLGYVLDHLGEAAAPLAPVLRERLGAVALDDRLYDLAGPLLYGLTALRAAEAMPEVLRVLRGVPEYRREWVVELVLRALTAFGPAAGEAVPDLRELLRPARPLRGDARSGAAPEAGGALSPAFRAKAAAALWAVEGSDSADVVLPVLLGALSEADTGGRRSAATALGTMGPAAAVAEPALTELLAAADPWTRVDAAVALWRVTGSPRRAWPVLRAAWHTLPFTRVPTAQRLAAGGGITAVMAVDGAEALLRSELAGVRRHNAIDGGYGSHDIVRDEKLLALCRRALIRERRSL